MILADIAVDPAKEKGGVWIDIGDGGKLLIARYDNPNFVRLFNELRKPHMRLAQSGKLSEEKAAEILAEALSQAVLLDWRGIQLAAGETDIPYSQKKAFEILKDPIYKQFRQIVIELATEESHFRQEQIEESSKN